MQTFLDFLPVVAFVVAYWLTDFKTATLVIMVAVALQVALTWLIRKSVNRMLLISAGLVIGLGGISLVLQNDLVFKWKPTVLNWAFALAFLASGYVGSRKTVIQRILESVANNEIQLAASDWRVLNHMWVAYFVLAGSANLFVAYRYSEAVWVNFKLFGLLGMTVAFLLVQAVWLSRRSLPPTAVDHDKRK
jgi:intracellular septation protein